ncbi:ABC transporter substrate-binding protein [Aeromicrobium sp. UC242_57]|uniref:ABC transporter substrate-binding protein n=1 Tax=Aeromicrobium sp. UC242_57 TaxID=3374624 RepID=UPI0037BD682C
MKHHLRKNRARKNRAVALAATIGLAAATLAACGSDKDSASAQDSGTLRITTLGLCNETSVYWAEKNGIFEDNGLKVELVKSTGGAAALTALQSGDIDLAFTNPFSTMIARSQGIDVRWIATAYETTSVKGEGTNAMAVTEDSGITKASDLNGKTIGVNEIGGINEIITTEWLTINGADASSVKFVALPFNELASSVANGKIDSAQIPAQNVDPKLGLTSLEDPYVAVGNGKGLVFAGYVATSKNATSKEKSLKAFQDSLITAVDEYTAPENADAKYALQSEKCKQDAAYLKSLKENIYEARVDTEAIARMGKILEEQERLDGPAEIDDLVPSYIVTK